MSKARSVFRRVPGILFSVALLLASLSGCSDAGVTGDKTVDRILEQTSAVTSVDSSILLTMTARIGSSGSADSHTASIESDASISSTFSPYAYHAEIFSRILVDGASSRENLEYYVVPDENNYVQYEYIESADEWQKNTLSKSETMAVPIRTGYLTDWYTLLSSASECNETTNEDDVSVYEYIGEVDSSILQEIFGNQIFGTFLTSMERLLDENISFTLYVDAETFLPTELLLDFTERFMVTDMTIDQAEICVTYSNYNDVHEISVPKKVDVVSVDPNADFYSSYFIWNLFLPYINGQQGGGGSAGNAGLSFISRWDTFQVRIDDGMTEIPLSYENLNKLGYTIDDSCASTILEPTSTVENIPVMKGSDKMICSFYNPETTPQPIISCGIASIDISASNLVHNGIRVYLPGEVTLGISREALLSAYGDPDETIKSFAADTLIWNGETKHQSFLAEISPLTNQVIRLKLTCNPLPATDIVVPSS